MQAKYSKFIVKPIVLALLFVNLSSYSETKSGIENNLDTLKDKIFLDVHVHYKPEEKREGDYNEKDFIGQFIAKKSFLISDSYNVPGYFNKNLPLHQEIVKEKPHIFDDKTVSKINKETVEFIKKYPDKFLGICGFNWFWKEIEKKVDECLSHSEMVGVKIHDKAIFEPISPERFESSLNELLSYLKNKKIVVLWHLDFGYWPSIAKNNVEYFLNIVKNNDNIQWIIAHAYQGEHENDGSKLKEMAQIEDRLFGAKLPNLWAEPSTTYLNGVFQFEGETLDNFRSFGMERFLFGTDIEMKRKPRYEQIRLYKTLENPENEILQEEMDKIIKLNPIRLFQQLGLEPLMK